MANMKEALKKVAFLGITSEEQLLEEMKNMKPIDIGIFVSPIPQEILDKAYGNNN